jgi:hypothetical protein
MTPSGERGTLTVSRFVQQSLVAEQTLELRLLKKCMTGDGGDHE